MTQHAVMIKLEEQAMLELHEVLLDDDAPGALAFIRNFICPQIPAKGSAGCDSTRINPYLIPDTAKKTRQQRS